MTWDPYRDGNQVNVRVGEHRVEVVIGELSAEFRRGRLGSVLVCGADGLELVFGERMQSRDMRVSAPAASSRGDGCPNDANANLVRHSSAPFAPLPLRGRGWGIGRPR